MKKSISQNDKSQVEELPEAREKCPEAKRRETGKEKMTRLDSPPPKTSEHKFQCQLHNAGRKRTGSVEETGLCRNDGRNPRADTTKFRVVEDVESFGTKFEVFGFRDSELLKQPHIPI